MTKNTLLALALALPLCAYAAPPAAPATPPATPPASGASQQPATGPLPNTNPSRTSGREKMALCTKAAHGLGGAEKQQAIQQCMRAP